MKHLRIFCVMLMLTVLSALEMSCGGTYATSMRLVKTEGAVSVVDDQGSAVPIKESLGLYSGYHVGTEKESYAWIDLDSTKLTKLDTESEAQVQRTEDQLEIVVSKGNLFFNVTEPLPDGETMDIRCSTMMVGIRGTCGWVSVQDETQMRVYILEGTVECSVTPPEPGGTVTSSVSSGEMAVLTFKDGKADISISDFGPAAIPDFVLEEMQDDSLNEQVAAEFGTDIRQWAQSAVTVTMPVTDLEIRNLLDTDGVDTVIVRPDGENRTLTVDHGYDSDFLYVDEGETLILEEGMSIEVTDRLQITGTLRTHGDFTVNGGNVVNAGIIEVAGSASILGDGIMQMNDGSYTSVEQGLINRANLRLAENSEFVGNVTVYNNKNNILLGGKITGNLALHAAEESSAVTEEMESTDGPVAITINQGVECTVTGSVILESGNQALGSGNYNTVVINGGNLYIGNYPGGDLWYVSINNLTVNSGTAYIRQFPEMITISSIVNNGGEVVYVEN